MTTWSKHLASDVRTTTNARQGERGFTLLELLVTMSVLAVLMGIGAGVFTNLRFEAKGTAGIVKTVVRATREEAVRSGLPARVDFRADEQSVRGTFFQVIGSWQFETAARAYAPNVPRTGTRQAAPQEGGFWGFDSGALLTWNTRGTIAFHERGGFPGGYLSLADKSAAELLLGGSQTFLTDRGFAVQFAARIGDDFQGVLARRPEAWELAYESSGALTARIGLAEAYGEIGRQRTAGVILMKTRPRVLVPGRFTRVALVFDGRRAQILVDGREEARDDRDLERYVPVRPDSTITFGGRGRLDIDDLRVYGVAEQGPVDLPEDATLSLRGSTGSKTLQHLSVFFTADGYLDPRQHPVPLEFAVEVASAKEGRPPRVDVYRIGLLGTVQDPGERPQILEPSKKP